MLPLITGICGFGLLQLKKSVISLFFELLVQAIHFLSSTLNFFVHSPRNSSYLSGNLFCSSFYNRGMRSCEIIGSTRN
ncbi:hypothetical protein VIGAN_01155300 [Vigna angularis var. angularis]|uniref:Uncharacterized protein n=1 Tax=Vigna angularis var. angularis TaxID=157739 RepID=A0A0S3R046_PHAAN|nr:hypothetical protein VIGAN_01155300 [Vigna angularis var. angularis]